LTHFKGPNSLSLLNKYLSKNPEDASKIFLSIKGGMLPPGHNLDCSPAGVRQSVENSIRQLPVHVKKIDLFECCRVDPKTDIETTIGTLGELVKEGKIGGIGLSEVKAETVRRAAKVHQIAAVEVELSMWETSCITNGVAKACADLGIPLIAYSPLGRGILTGQIRKHDDIPEDDMRRHFPRFSKDNFPLNMKIVEKVEVLAKKKGVTAGQLALAWITALSGRDGLPTIIPIPGATTESRVSENTKNVTLSDAEFKEIDDLVKSVSPVGNRYPEMLSSLSEG